MFAENFAETRQVHCFLRGFWAKNTHSVHGIYYSERKITLSTDWIQEKHNGKWTPCFFGDSAQIQGCLRSKFCFRALKSMAAEVPAVAPDPEVPGGTGRRSLSLIHI